MTPSCDRPHRARSNALERRARSARPKPSKRTLRPDPGTAAPRSNALERPRIGTPGERARRAIACASASARRLAADRQPARSNALDRGRTPPPASWARAARTPPFEDFRPPETPNPGWAGVRSNAFNSRRGLMDPVPPARTSPRRRPSPRRSVSRPARSARRPTAAASGRTRSGRDCACCETPPGP